MSSQFLEGVVSLGSREIQSKSDRIVQCPFSPFLIPASQIARHPHQSAKLRNLGFDLTLDIGEQRRGVVLHATHT